MNNRKVVKFYIEKSKSREIYRIRAEYKEFSVLVNGFLPRMPISDEFFKNNPEGILSYQYKDLNEAILDMNVASHHFGFINDIWEPTGNELIIHKNGDNYNEEINNENS